MAEWNKLVEHCSNDLPVFVWRNRMKARMAYASVATTYLLWKSFFFHVGYKASVHRHCVLDALTTNDQCVYCRKYLSPQDILDCSSI
jgi:hypothetical protein